MPVELHLYAAFIAASLVLLVVPGPTVIMVISQALAHGRRTALACVAGVGLADVVAASLSLLGAGTILAASAAAFEAIKWVGAAYLVWIGIKMWRAPVTPHLLDLKAAAVGERILPVFRDSFLVTVFNPKGLVFYMAFAPQFVSSSASLLATGNTAGCDLRHPQHGQCGRLCAARQFGPAVDQAPARAQGGDAHGGCLPHLRRHRLAVREAGRLMGG